MTKGIVKLSTPTLMRPPNIESDLNNIDELIDMLSYRRPSKSLTEQEFIRKFIIPTGAEPDGFGNFVLTIGDLPILWSCHTDSVHRYDGRQHIRVSGDLIASLDDKNFMSNCLGADDATGCWIMRQMIANNIPGQYVFHRGEEIGGIGSKWKANHDMDIEDYEIAIAFDRMGYGDVINSQFGGKCASDNFCEALAKMLGSWWKPTSGVFTDTAQYALLIPECTNLSVGYFFQHTERETQDLVYASWLRDQIIKFDFNELLSYVERDPYREQMKKYKYKSDENKTYSSLSEYYDSQYYNDDDYHNNINKEHDMAYYVEQYPKAIADLIENLGLTAEDVKEYICEIYHGGLDIPF